MLDETRPQAIEFLDTLEGLEARLLTWGLVDGAFTEDELIDLAEDHLDGLEDAGLTAAFGAGDELIEWLVHARLLYALPATDPCRYRTRMAEGIRLFSRLRQFFSEGRWRTAPSLVADYRFHRRPRVFPRRDIGIEQVEETLGRSDGEARVVRAMLAAGSEKEILASGFQLRAAESILDGLATGKVGGTLVSAGTASGKSLSFYLPAVVHLVQTAPAVDHAQVLAIYPRKELLKDQFRATLEHVVRLDEPMQAVRGRAISVGAFYGDVPDKGDDLNRDAWREAWPSAQTGRICPYVICPHCGTGQMVWPDSDREAHRERLVCLARACGGTLEQESIRLTRKRMAEEPPDFLFTTTEMLNREISAHRYRRLFGVQSRGSPSLVLLDEVHTYSGVSGAQVALLLRRWRYLARVRPHFVGLSATLIDGQAFFSELTGVPSSKVRHVEPTPDEMDREGTEYLLALRGDPVSGTALLSTTIQASMLLSRILNSRESPRGDKDAYGSRVFVFTDNLDVTNRLFDGLRDAEGFWASAPNRRSIGSLANLRSSSLPDHRDRSIEGQSWDLAEEVGHSLARGERRRVGRTSSQDQGVDSDASVVVATATLEVGFDDPTCGAVIQHKAPRDGAAFIQRRGRAGRGRAMRPWTLVVLSDYGRDRVAYQGYEQLFSPTVVPTRLPVRNSYVSRIQAGYALLDWLSQRIRQSRYSSAWSDLSGHRAPSYRRDDYVRELRALLRDPSARGQFERHLRGALGLAAAAVDDLMWTAPRPMLLEVVPTLLRRLESDWTNSDGTTDRPEGRRARDPLPEFVTPNLFGDLSLSELAIAVGRSRSDYRMGFRQGLAEFAPGRVSKRFAIERGGVSHWIALPTDGSRLAVESFVDLASALYLGEWMIPGDDGQNVRSQVITPRQLNVTVVPADIADTANAFLTWHTSVHASSPGRPIELPAHTPWRQLIEGLFFFSHSTGNPLEVRRCARGARYGLRHRNGDVHEGRIGFTLSSDGVAEPAALGLGEWVDGLLVELCLPNEMWTQVEKDAELLRGVRTALFQARVLRDGRLDGLANQFQRGWLCDIYLSCLTFNALSQKKGLDEVAIQVSLGQVDLPLTGVLPIIFQSPELTDDIDPDDVRLRQGRRLYTELEALLREDVVLAVLRDAATVLWEQPSSSWDGWLRARTQETVAAALLGASERLCQGIDSGDILVHIEPGQPGPNPVSGVVNLWLVEAKPGGVGFIEQLRRSVTEDCRQFFSLVADELEPSDFELVDRALHRVLSWASDESPSHDEAVARALADYRAAHAHREGAAAYGRLAGLLRERGVTATASVQTAVNLRLLRSGTSMDSDRVLFRLVTEWLETEAFLGVEVGARVFAYLKSGDESLEEMFEGVTASVPVEDRRAWRCDLLFSLLWPRGQVVRQEALRYYTPFSAPPEPDRLLVQSVMGTMIEEISVDDELWRSRLQEVLLLRGEARLSVSVEGSSRLREVVLSLVADPIDTGSLLLHPEASATSTDGKNIWVDVLLPEYAG